MSDIKGLREISNDPFGKLLTALSKKFSAFLAKDQAELVENPEDVYSDGQDVESALKYHNFVMTKRFDLVTPYYSSADPDFNKLSIWIIGRSLGTNLRDYSGFDSVIDLHASDPDPILVDGAPLDWGIADGTLNTKSITLRMNRSGNFDYIRADDASRFNVLGISAGISYFIRFRVFDLANQAGLARTLFQKIDDSTPSNAAMLVIESDGRLKSYIKRAGAVYQKQTAAGTITTDTVYDVWLTYAVSGNITHIYVNNVDKSLTPSSDSPVWQADLTNEDLFVFRRGFGTPGGYVHGDLYDFRLYREKVISSAEVSYVWVNKWTIADIPFGQVLITNYSASCAVAPLLRVSKSLTCKFNISGHSFTSTSFSPTSFTT